MSTKKLGVIQRLFGSKKLSIDDDDAVAEAGDETNAILEEFKRCSYSRRHTVDVETFRGELTDEALMAAAGAKYSPVFGATRGSYENCNDPGTKQQQRPIVRVASDKVASSDNRKPPAAGREGGSRRSKPSPGTSSSETTASTAAATGRHRRSGVYVTAAAAKAASGTGAATRPTNHSSVIPAATAAPPPKAIRTLLGPGIAGGRSRAGGGSFKRRSVRKDRKNVTGGAKVDTTKPLTFPTTPETILEYHKARPFLDENEEWLMVELNEYECLVDSLAIIKIIAKHSKFFEVEPAELWEEFFEFVDDVPSYDEVINFDVWQEFRDKKYTC